MSHLSVATAKAARTDLLAKLQLELRRVPAVGASFRKYSLSANLIQLWLTQFDRGELVGEEAARHLDHFAPPPDGAACGPLMIATTRPRSRRSSAKSVNSRWSWDGEHEARGELTLEQAALALSTSKMTVLRMISAGTLTATQACKGAPWVIKAVDVRRPEVRAAVAAPGGSPLPEDPRQISLELQ
jgi:excisionase family DNA binding protein